MQRRIRLVDLVTARDAISPNVAELIEMIDPAAGDQNEIVDVSCCFQKASDFFGVIAYERRTKQYRKGAPRLRLAGCRRIHQ